MAAGSEVVAKDPVTPCCKADQSALDLESETKVVKKRIRQKTSPEKDVVHAEPESTSVAMPSLESSNVPMECDRGRTADNGMPEEKAADSDMPEEKPADSVVPSDSEASSIPIDAQVVDDLPGSLEEKVYGRWGAFVSAQNEFQEWEKLVIAQAMSHI